MQDYRRSKCRFRRKDQDWTAEFERTSLQRVHSESVATRREHLADLPNLRVFGAVQLLPHKKSLPAKRRVNEPHSVESDE